MGGKDNKTPMTKHIPNSLCISGTIYKVKYKNIPEVNEEEVQGYCDTKDKLIIISKQLTVQEQIHVFFHEIFHCVLHEVGLSAVLNGEIEEVIVDNCGKAVLNYLQKMYGNKICKKKLVQSAKNKKT